VNNLASICDDDTSRSKPPRLESVYIFKVELAVLKTIGHVVVQQSGLHE